MVMPWPALLLLAAALAPSAADPLEILVLYDNTSTRPDVAADWGFAALVSYRGQKILFDSGTKPDLLRANMKALAVDPAAISQAVFSHAHGDHLDGMPAVFPLNPAMKVHYLDAFPAPVFQRAASLGMHPVRVKGPVEIAPGIFTTGIVEGNPPEQALVVETTRGLVVITGCSHPGVVRMVEAAERQRGAKSVRFLLGGFHMLQQSEAAAGETVARLRALGVASIAPTHCTGDMPIRLFQKAYGDAFRAAGAGRRIVMD